MKNLKILTSKGIEVELTEVDMMKINKYYKVQHTADYLRENYKWDENKIQWIANETRELMNDYDISEDEAIEEATVKYNKRYK